MKTAAFVVARAELDRAAKPAIRLVVEPLIVMADDVIGVAVR